jgi:hypothetical protein
LSEDDREQGRRLPLPGQAPKNKSRKKATIDVDESPPLHHVKDNGGIKLGQLMVGQPCCQDVSEIMDHMPSRVDFTQDDALVLDTVISPAHNSSLAKLAQLMWAKFRGRLYDLFKFGL